MKKTMLVALLAVAVLPGESSAWHECPPIQGCFWHAEDPLFHTVGEVVDGATCPTLAAAGQSGVDVPGIAEVYSDGDVVVLGDEIWVCPPYET